MEFKIALLQLLPEDTTEKNLIKGLEACRKARHREVDIMGGKYRHTEKYEILVK